MTRLCGVIGHPIAHSLSPAIHNAALQHDGRDAEYRAFDVTDAAKALRELAEQGVVGVNVTLPHKRAAWELASSRSPAAEEIGAANTIMFEEGGAMAAHNTDPGGVLGALRDLAVDVSGAQCLVIGAGGAGRAAAWALRSSGASEVVIANRTRGRAAGIDAIEVLWDRLDRAVESADVVVQATSVGMNGEASLVSGGTLAKSHCRAVLDLVYTRQETDLVRTARVAGIVAADGLGVLVHQAAAAYEIFWGAPAPLEVMAEAACTASGRPSLI